MPPVGGNLQHCRPGKPAMREQCGLAKADLVPAHLDIGRYARKLAEQDIVGTEGEGHERGARLHYREPELARDVISEAGSSKFRDRGAAGGEDKRPRRMVLPADPHVEQGVAMSNVC